MKKPSGFTLIEILIVIAIGSVVMTIAAARYNQLTQRKRVEQQTKNTVTFLRKIRKMVNSGGRSGCSVGTVLEYFQVWNDAGSPDELEGLPVCSGSSGSEFVLKNQTGTKVQAQRPFKFLPLSKGASVDNPATPATEQTVKVIVSNTNNSLVKEIEIDSGGNINEL